MDITIKGGALQGEIGAVTSKSAAHRALICAALSDRPTRLRTPQSNEDIDATANCLRALGADITREKDCLLVSPIGSVPANTELNCGESGSTLRFLLPVAAAICPKASFSGKGRLPQRPIGELQEAMGQNGVVFDGNSLPFSVSGKLRAGKYEIAGDVSSQYVSGLLMALPLLDGDSEIVLKSPLGSAPYVDMTLDMQKNFGIEISRTENGFSVRGGQVYHSPQTFEIEGDWSGAAFFLVGGAIGGDVTVSGLDMDSRQGDRAIVEILRQFGACVTVSGSSVRVQAAPLTACSVDVSEIPDLLPILSVLAAKADGKTLLFNAERLRHKESDRLKASAAMINSLGGRATEYPDRLEIIGTKLTGGVADSFGDHRIAMSAAIAASIGSGVTKIINSEVVSKSYTEFFKDYVNLGGEIIT